MTTTSTIKIDSDVTGRFKRIINQVEFDGDTTFITELLQNCQRAQATKVEIMLEENRLIIRDNGVGCEDPLELFTLDLSGFGYGFGQGFSSVYGLLGQVKVKTLNWEAEIDVEKLASKRTLKAADLEVPVHYSDYYAGFYLELVSDKIKNSSRRIERAIRKVSSTIKDIVFILNGEVLPKYDIFKAPENRDFHELVNNRIYEGRLYADPGYDHKGIDVYYDDRFVQSIHYELQGLSGNILIKPNKVRLKAPDRTSIIWDEKRDALINRLKKDFVNLLIRILKEGDVNQIEEHADIIRNNIPTEQFIRYLQIDANLIKNQYELRETVTHIDHSDHDQEDNSDTTSIETDIEGATDKDEYTKIDVIEQATENNNHHFDESGMTEQKEESIQNVGNPKTNVQERDMQRYQENLMFSSYVSEPNPNLVSKHDMEHIGISNIKKKANVVWVEKNREDDFSKLIAKYEYYGIFTFVSPHGLYDDALKHLGVNHIEDVEHNAIEKKYNVTRIGAKNKKEIRATEILHRIELLFGLNETFYISDIECKMIVSLNETKMYQEKLSVAGYSQGNVIHLNRKSLPLGKLSSTTIGKESLGIHDIKFLLANIELIAHELAHRLYNTADNTTEHYEMIFEIQKKIGQFILTNE